MSTAATETTTASTKNPLVPLIGAVLGLTTAVVLMLLAFVTPAVNSGAHNLPLTVSGTPAATAQVAATLEAKQPGAFDITQVTSTDEARERVAHRDAIGAISLGADGVTIQTASAAGAPYSTLLHSIGAALSAQGQKVSYTDVAPYTKDDPTGAGLNTLALPLAFGGMASAAVLSNVIKGGSRRSRTVRRTLGSLAFAALAGLAVAALLHYAFGTIGGNYFAEAGVFALGIAAISLFVLGLESNLGMPGLAIGGVLMIFVANPLSGLSTGAAWLPSPWGALGQLFPIGAAGTAIRSLGFFDGHGMTQALWVLVAWVLMGLALTLVSAARTRRAQKATPAPAN